jgi:transposase
VLKERQPSGELQAASTGRVVAALGHEVRLMPPAYVKAYLRRQKNDAADAEAICEAVRRPSMRFVPAKGAERQAVLVLHRSRELLVRQRTMLINAIRGHCAEFGLVAAHPKHSSPSSSWRIRYCAQRPARRHRTAITTSSAC